MARADSTLAGITRFGGGAEAKSGVHIQAPRPLGGSDVGVANQPGVLMLDSVDTNGLVTTRYLWVGNDGKLRIHTSYPVTEVSDGTVVGTQS